MNSNQNLNENLNPSENQKTSGSSESRSEINKRNDLEKELRSFIGTEQYYKHQLGVMYTDGVQFLAEKAGAYWLIDAIASYQTKRIVFEYPFQIWTLTVNNNQAALEMKGDSGFPVAIRQHIKFTDFPLDEIKLYLIDGILLLPSEY